MDVFRPMRGVERAELRRRLNIAPDAPVIVNPRGIRRYAASDTFFEAITAVLQVYPELVVLCPDMERSATANRWVSRLGIESNVRLLPRLAPIDMATLYQVADISISITTHDGTPNTLLEAMASGCLPIASDIASIREWITPGDNGWLCNPHDSQSLAKLVIAAIDDEDFRCAAAKRNLERICQRAEFSASMSRAVEFYSTIVDQSQASMMRHEVRSR